MRTVFVPRPPGREPALHRPLPLGARQPSPQRQLAALFELIRIRVIKLKKARMALLFGAGTVGSLTALLGTVQWLGPSSAWLALGIVWGVGTVLSFWRFVIPVWKRRPSDDEMARLIARHAPDLRSDLLSALQLGRSLPAGASAPLADELILRTAAACSTVDVRRVASRSPLWRLLGLLLLVLVLFVVRLSAMWQGAKLLLQGPPPTPIATSPTPLIGDLRLLLTYPKYTGLLPQVIPSSTGDVTVLPGTEVRIEARSLYALDTAQLFVQTKEQTSNLPVQLVRAPGELDKPPLLVATLITQQPQSYYFQVERTGQGFLRESSLHRVDIELDRPPSIDLFAPADRLDVTGTRRIELGYSAEDDLGLGDIDLVYQVGGAAEKRKRVRSAAETRPAGDGMRASLKRSVAAKIEWDLGELDLTPGTTVTYHMEARDLDTVRGPNVGQSKRYTLGILGPREKSDALLASQERLRELLLLLLADRLEWSRHIVAVQPAPIEPPSEWIEKLAAIHRQSETLLVHLGQVSKTLPSQGRPKDLDAVLQGIGQRLGRLTQDEGNQLLDLRNRRAAPAPRRTPSAKELALQSERHVQELEHDVLLLDDLIGRQRMEELLAIGDEMTSARDQLKKLLNEYKRHPSESLKQEIARELRAFERRLAELQERASRLAQDVPDEFLNPEAMNQSSMQARVDRLKELLDSGQLDRVMNELDGLSRALDGMMKGMEAGLKTYRRERFSAEDKAVAEVENQVRDLVHDQEDLRARTEAMKQTLSQRSQQAVRDRTESLSRRLLPEVAKLRKLLGDIEVAPLGVWGEDELDKAEKRLDDLQRMLEQGDLDEARAMAGEAGQNIERIETDLRAEEQASRWGQRVKLGRSRQKAEQAKALAKEIEAEISRALPRPEDLLSPQERRQASELRQQQEALRRRTGELSRELGKRAGQLRDEAPALGQLQQQVDESLRRAGGQMSRSEQELSRLSPRAAAAAQGQALDQLGQLQKQLQQVRRPQSDGAGSKAEREPVKIPGMEEYRAPKEFRQDILNAAKREPPPEYRDQVKQYYEELIR